MYAIRSYYAVHLESGFEPAQQHPRDLRVRNQRVADERLAESEADLLQIARVRPQHADLIV